MISGEKYRILAVDDDETVLEMIESCLEGHHEVVCALGGQNALDVLSEVEPDFIILDLMMKDIHGFDLLRVIRELPEFKNTPVLILSGKDTRDNITQSYALGAQLFLPKPISPERLEKNINLFFKTTPPPFRIKKHTCQNLFRLYHPGEEMPEALKREEEPQDTSANTGMPHGFAPKKHFIPRVLVVEDDESLRELLQLQLEFEYEVVLARDGFDGMEKAAIYMPDLILLDVMMPKMNGYRLCQTLRGNEAFADTPIIIMTAKQSSRESEFAGRMGANHFLPKPFEMDDLAKLCREIVNEPGFVVRPKNNAVFKPNPAVTDQPQSPERKKSRVISLRLGKKNG